MSEPLFEPAYILFRLTMRSSATHHDHGAPSAQQMVRRFRESEPMPRSERPKMAEGELWYIDRTNKPTDNNTQLRTTDESEVQPRSGSAPVATAKPTKKAHSEVLARLRQPTDYMSMTARARFSEDRGPGLDVDELIANEIRGLEREMKIQTRVSVDTFDPRGSAQYSDFEPVYRYNPGGGGFGVSRGPAGGGGGGGQSARDAMRMSGGSDYLRSSVETLGSTGFRGLLDPALRLDSVWEVRAAPRPRHMGSLINVPPHFFWHH
jgi:hypothetical protein